MASKPVPQEVSLYRPPFPSSWTPYSLFDLAEWVNGLAYRDVDFSLTGLPIIKIAEIKAGITSQTGRSEKEFPKKYKVERGDILFSWSGQPETSIDTFVWRGDTGWLNQHIFRVSPKRNLIREDFFRILMRYLRPTFIAIARNKQTTGLGHVTKSDLQRIEVRVPDQHTQKTIAVFPIALEERINQLERTNACIENIAGTIFKSWFVDFDPVRAKAEGRELEGMDAATAALFPSEFEQSELGPIPIGWNAGHLGGVCEIARSVAQKASILADDKYVGLEHIPRESWALAEWGTAEGLQSGKSRFVVGDILFGKLRPYFHKVCIAPVDGVCSTDILVLRPVALWMPFVLCHVSSKTLIEYATRLSNGAKMPRTKWQDLYSYPIAVPSERLAEKFADVIRPIVLKIIGNVHATNTLAEIRNTLLPRLISGKLRVPEAEKMVEAVL